MEKESGMVLDWFEEYWINTTHVTDYGIDTVYEDQLVISRYGAMPMPIEIVVTLQNGKKELYYIPLALMRGEKNQKTHMQIILSCLTGPGLSHPIKYS